MSNNNLKTTHKPKCKKPHYRQKSYSAREEGFEFFASLMQPGFRSVKRTKKPKDDFRGYYTYR